MEILAYITWFLALCSTFSSFCFDKKKIILSIQSITLVLFSLHLFLIWGFSGAGFLCIQVFRNLSFAFIVNKIYTHIVLAILLSVYIAVYYTTKDIDSLALLPFTATILGTLGCYVSHTTWVRLFFFSSTLPFTYYVFLTGSYFAIIIQLTFMSSILINIVRFDILRLKK